MFKHILVPIDGGEHSDRAVASACDFAREAGARLTFYHAQPSFVGVYVSGEMMLNDPAIEAAFVARAKQQAEELLQRAAQAAARAGVAFETLTDECDRPHEGIIGAAQARACDLIFMASHGRRGVSALLLGSETQKVLTHCRVPVLVFR